MPPRRAATCLFSSREHHDLCHRPSRMSSGAPRGTPPGSWTATPTTPTARSPTRPRDRATTRAPPFNGYTQGPGYYGKTFFIWPPDPRRPLTDGHRADSDRTIKQFLTDFGYTRLISPILLSRQPSRRVLPVLRPRSRSLPPHLFQQVPTISCSCRFGNHDRNGSCWKRPGQCTRGKDGTSAASHYIRNNRRLGDRAAPDGIYGVHRPRRAARTGPGPTTAAPRSAPT